MMKVLILEDESLMAQRLETLLHQYDPGLRVMACIPSVGKAVKWLEANPVPDLLFMDIHLEDDLGFYLFERVKFTTPVIFTTAYDQYMVQAFKVSSLDYLLKPIQYEELAGAIEKYKSLQKHFSQPNLDGLLKLVDKPKEVPYKERFMVTLGNKLRSIELTEVAFFYVEDKVTFLVANGGWQVVIDYSLEKLVQVLEPRRFFRINRQYLVSISALYTIQTHASGKLKVDLQPKSRHAVFVSVDRIAAFKDWLGK